jgi:hypothetical protein
LTQPLRQFCVIVIPVVSLLPVGRAVRIRCFCLVPKLLPFTCQEFVNIMDAVIQETI